MNDDYPVRFAVDYPDRDLDRLTTAFRIFTVIPIAIVHRRADEDVAAPRQREEKLIQPRAVDRQ